MPESRGHNGGDENNIESPQIAEILKFRRNFFEILAAGTTEEIAYAVGFNEAVGVATHIAQQEEKRVRAIIERSDGVCLEERVGPVGPEPEPRATGQPGDACGHGGGSHGVGLCQRLHRASLAGRKGESNAERVNSSPDFSWFKALCVVFLEGHEKSGL